jgi:hypothetical protein
MQENVSGDCMLVRIADADIQITGELTCSTRRECQRVKDAQDHLCKAADTVTGLKAQDMTWLDVKSSLLENERRQRSR